MKGLWHGFFEEDSILHMRVMVEEIDTTLSVGFRCACADGPFLRLPWLQTDPHFEMNDCYVIFNFQVKQNGDEWTLDRLPSTSFLKLRGTPDFMSVIEPCSGMGGMTLGAKHLGVTTIAAVDHSPLAVDAWRINHGFQVLQGNILDGAVVAQLAAMTQGRRVGLLSGFPCPPFSSFGDRLGMQDARSDVMVQVLNVAFLLNCPYVILECTQHTPKFDGVTEVLHTFAQVMRFTLRTKVLHLHRSWPCFRTRWWAIFAPEEIAVFLPELCDLPIMPQFQKIVNVIPEWPTWPQPQIRALEWMQIEETGYLSHIAEEDALLDLEGVCPTLLHSAAHHFFPCPCGCRRQGLAPQRLARDGISTVAVRTAEGKLRHSTHRRRPT